MVATKHIRSSTFSTRVGGLNATGSGEHYAIESLLQHAASLTLRAPELAVVFGERASALAEVAGSDRLWARAESLVVSGRVRIGLRAESVGRAVAALRAAEDLGESALAAGLRTDLAVCARSVGAPLTALATLRPVLGVREFAGAGKAAALCHLVGCLSHFGRKPELDRTLTEADRLCGADDELDGDDRLLGRALVRVGVSAHRRRHSDVMGAADAARTGLGLLEQLDDPGADGGVVRVRLILQLVCSLLDRGDTKNAAEIAESVLAEPSRAASVSPLGWLRMAVATRVLIPSGSVEAAAVVLRDAVHSTERHGLHALNSRLWAELAHVEERLGRFAEAMECLHRSRAAEHLYTRARRQAMGLLAGEFGNGNHAALDLDEVLGQSIAVASDVSPAVHVPDSAVLAVAGRSSSLGTNGHSVPPRGPEPSTHAVDQSARVGGHPRPEADAAARTMIIPRIVEPTGASAKTAAAGARTSQSRGGSQRAATTSSTSDESAQQGMDQPSKPGGGSRRAEDAKPGDGTWRVDLASAESGKGKRRAETRAADDDGIITAAAKPVVRLEPVHVARPAVPDLPLAPPPADEPAPRVSLVFESKTVVKAEESEHPEEGSAKPKTRHDAIHGSVAARSVLDRLGISAGSGGGRRRAPDEPDPAEPAPAAELAPAVEPASAVEREPTAEPAPGRPAARPHSSAGGEAEGGEPAEKAVSAAQDSADKSREPQADEARVAEKGATETSGAFISPWLPRLRLPPSLEPFEGVPAGGSPSTSETPFTSAPVIEGDDELGEPFGAGYADSPPLDDELPADAGLADLLARALAEHQAGTSSAAALVKRLGNQGSDERRTVNGHGRNGEPPANGRHRGSGER